MALAPLGSVEDRIAREMVFRERQEKVAHLEAMAAIVAQIFGYDHQKVFNNAISNYAREVFQEGYDAELLRRKILAVRREQSRIKNRRHEDLRLINRLDKLGDYYDKTMGPVGKTSSSGNK